MSKNKITGKVLAIQLGREETQLVLVGKDSEILHGITVPTPQGAVEDGMIQDQEAVAGLLKTALETPEFKGVRQAVFVLCTSQVVMETATTPDLPKAKLEKLIQANADMYFPMDIRDYRLVWEVIGPRKNNAGVKELSVQLWAVPMEMVKRCYQAANACGLSVAAVDYVGHSAAAAVGASFSSVAKPAKAAKAPKEPKPKKKIDWNAEITFGKKKKVEPEIEPEGQTGPRIIPQTQLHILTDAELLGMTFVQEGHVVSQKFYQYSGDPAGEVAMMVDYFSSTEQGRGSEIWAFLSGPGGEDGVLAEELSAMLGIPVESSGSSREQRWMLCVSASHTDLDFGDPTFNNVHRARRQINSQLWQYAAILVSGAALIAVGLFTLNARLGWNSEIASLQSEYNILSTQAAKVNGFKANYDNYLAAYDAYDRDWDALFDSLHTYNDNLVFVLKELENVMPENTSVTDIVIDSDNVMISFACDDKEEAAYLIMSLRDMEYVDVNTISNLIGGGKGPATEYGTPIEDVAPPTEGGSTESTQVAATPAEQSNYNSATETANVATFGLESYSPSRDDLWTLEALYGKTPDTKMEHTSLAVYKEKHAPTLEQRQTAIQTLIGTNPFAANSFLSLMMEDFYRSDSAYVMGYFLQDPTGQALFGKILTGNMPSDYESAQEFLNDALDVLTKDETCVSGTEALLCAGDDLKYDPKVTYDMETAYVHYLEVASGLRSAQDYPYLNADEVAGGISTEKAELDSWLNAQLEGYTFPAPESSACDVCHEHSDTNTDNICDTCGSIIEDTACFHPEDLRHSYTQKEGATSHTYVCGVEGCGKTITENCHDADKDCYCDFCGSEKHLEVTVTPNAGKDAHNYECKTCGETWQEQTPCTDANGDELCDICGTSLAITRPEIEMLEHTHGQVPQPNTGGISSYEEYLAYVENIKPTYFEREAAIINLFCNNAFAANDYVEDIAAVFVPEYTIDKDAEFKSVQTAMETVKIYLQYKGVDENEKKLAQIEELIFSSDDPEKYDVKTAYLYYLEVAMGRTAEKNPHLLDKDMGDMEDKTDAEKERILTAWEYVNTANGKLESSRANYENFLYNYLMANEGDQAKLKALLGTEMLEDLEKYFNDRDSNWKADYDTALKNSELLKKVLIQEFLYNYYQDSLQQSDTLHDLIVAYRNEQVDYNEELLLVLKQCEREAEIAKDVNQDEKIAQNEKDIADLKKQLASLKQAAADQAEEEAGGGSGSGASADTRVFLDIGLLYTEELWDQELQRKGLDRTDKLPRLELEVG